MLKQTTASNLPLPTWLPHLRRILEPSHCFLDADMTNFRAAHDRPWKLTVVTRVGPSLSWSSYATYALTQFEPSDLI